MSNNQDIALNMQYDTSSREELIEKLQTLQQNNDHPISRDFARKNGIIDAEWSSYFSTFNSFKLAAGLSPTKTALKEIRAFEKHESVETLKEYNKTKFGWKNIWKKDSLKRFQTFLVCSDVHDLHCDPFFRRLFVLAVKQYKPEKIILNGDIFDMPEVSKYTTRLADLKPKERVLWVSNFLYDLREASPDSEINFVEGNHEYRLIHHLLEKTPSMVELLDIHGFDIKTLLGLDNYEVNYYSSADIATFTEADIRNELKKNYYIFKDFVVFYHFPQGRTIFGMPGISGHHHKLQIWPEYNATYGSYNWMQIGAGATRHADYTDAAGKWQNGFALVHVDLNEKKNTTFEYIDCTGEVCVLNGNRYLRYENEKTFQPLI